MFPILPGIFSQGGAQSPDLALPEANQLFYWYAGSGESIPVEVTTAGDGSPVTALADKSVSGYDLAKDGAGTVTYHQVRPELAHRGGIEFDGNSYLWRAINGILANLNTYTLYVVMRTTSTDATMMPYAERSVASGTPLVAMRPNTGGASKLNWLHRSDGSVSAADPTAGGLVVAINDGKLKIITLRRISSNSWSLRLNGVAIGSSTGAPGATTVDRLGIGASLRAVADEHYIGDIAMIAGYSADNCASVEPVIMGHYAASPGAWTWYNDQRAVASGSTLFVGSITRYGDVQIWTYNTTDNTRTAPITLRSAWEIDDHNNPSILIRASDSRVMAFYTKHDSAAAPYYMWLSTNPLDVSAGAEVDISSQIGASSATYANPFQLTGETDDPIYLFWREWPNPTYSKSTDGGVNWSAGQAVFNNGVERPYVKYAQNGDSRIDFALTDGHPNNVATNSIYHGYYQAGNIYKSDGALVGGIDDGPYAPSALTKIYDGTTVRSWIHGISIGTDGHPVIVFATFPSTTDHRYRYARWNGSAWSDAEICTAGTYLYAVEAYYSGGVTIDPAHTSIVYASRDTGSGVHQVWKYTTSDGGATWNAGEQLTSGADKSIRPFVAGGRLLYMTGTYTTYGNFPTSIVARPT